MTHSSKLSFRSEHIKSDVLTFSSSARPIAHWISLSGAVNGRLRRFPNSVPYLYLFVPVTLTPKPKIHVYFRTCTSLGAPLDCGCQTTIKEWGTPMYQYQNQALLRLANVIRKMPTKRYTDYLRSPAWAWTRKAHLEHVEYICEHCHMARACQVHHTSYIRLGHELPVDLFAVCVNCHHKLHSWMVPEAANDNQPDLPFRTSTKQVA